MSGGADRYYAKRDAGISPVRRDGSVATPENDRQAAAAEQFAAAQLGCPFNDSVTAHGDGGHDFVFPLHVEVCWLGVNQHTGEPRRDGHLIVNLNEPHRWADIYIVVAGTVEMGFHVVGWTTHNRLIEYGTKNFGYGEKLAMPVRELWSLGRLYTLQRSRGNGNDN